MDDGSIVFKVDADDQDAEKKLEKLRREIEKTEKAVAGTEAKHNGIVESLENARAAAEKTQAEIKAIHEQIAENDAVLSGQSGDVGLEEFNARKQAQAELSYELKEQEKLYAAKVKEAEKLSAQEQKVKATLEQQTAQLRQQKEEAGAVVEQMAKQSGSIMPQLKAQTQEMSKAMNKGFKNILKWGFGIRSTFILMRKLKSAIIDGVSAFAEYDTETKASIDGLKQSLKQLKVSWGAAFAPILNTVAPLLQKLIGWLQIAADFVNQLFSALSGKTTYRRAIVQNTDSNEDLSDSYTSVGEAAKAAKREIMGFDEINKLSKEDTDKKTDKDKDSDTPGIIYEDVPITSGVATGLSKVIETVKKHLKELELFAAGMALGLGLVLTFSGANIPLGLALIAIGAIGLARAVTENWGAITANVRSALGAVEMVVSGLLLGVGAALAFSGTNIPLGLALMAAGAVGLAAAVALNWEEIPARVRRVIADIAMAVGGSMLAVGALLTFSGVNIPLGLGLMAAGALTLATGVATNWTYITSNVGHVLTALGTILGGAALALGAVILFATPAFSPLGLGLMIAGAAALAGSVAVNWDFVKEKVRGTTGGIIAICSAALLALGAVITFACPAMLPLGIGLMAAGAIGLASMAAVNWDSIVTAVRGPVGKITAIAGASLLALGLILCLTGAGIPLGIGMMLVGGASLAGAVAINWNAITGKIRDTLSNIVRSFNDHYNSLKTKTANLKQSFQDRMREIRESASTTLSNMQTTVQTKADGMKTAFLNRLDALRSGANSRLESIRTYFSNAITRIRNLMNFQWAFPKPKMPHFHVTWQQLGRWFSLPHVSISWYARGGVFDSASIIGVGEQGSEAVVPLERNTGWMNTIADGIVSRLLSSNTFADAISGRAMPAMASGSVIPPGSISGNYTEALADAVRRGFSDALSLAMNSGSGRSEETQPINIYIGDEKIANYILRLQKRSALISGGR